MKTLVLLGDRNPNVITHCELDATPACLPEGIEANWIAKQIHQTRQSAPPRPTPCG